MMRIGSILLAALLTACAPPGDGGAADDSGVDASGDKLTGAQKVGSTLITTADVNLRAGASTSDAVVEVLPAGTKVTLLDGAPSNGFYHVQHGDRSGYCSGKYLMPTTSDSGTTPSGGGDGGGPSAAAILAALGSGCDEITKGRLAYDDGGTPKVPVCRTSGAVYWTADLDVDCDGISSSACSKKTDPDYQSQTASVDSKGKPLDASTLPYVVVPLVSSRFSYKDAGLALGSVVAVIYKGQVSYGIIGDLGPSSAIGEASYAMARSLGMDPSPTHGGADSGVTYVAFTGTSAHVTKKESHDEAVSIGQSKANALVGH